MTFLPSQSTSNFLIVSAGTVRLGDGDDVFIAIDTVLTNVLINGNADDDVLFFGNSVNTNAITSLEGSSVYGGDGNDLIGISGANILGSRINGNKGNDEIILLDVEVIRSSIFGGQGDDKINIDSTNSGDSIITDSVISGGLGDDEIIIGDTKEVQLEDVIINGNEGNDVIKFNDDLFTGSADVTVFGGQGNDEINASVVSIDLFLSGGEGVDTIAGGLGDDTITGGDGADELTGTGGDNLFLYLNSGETGVVATGVVDRITDFDHNGDSIGGLGVFGVIPGEFTAVAGTTGNTYAQALAAANVVFAAAKAQSYFMTSFGTNGASAQGVLFLNMDNNATADGAILIGTSNQTSTMAAATALLIADNIIA